MPFSGLTERMIFAGFSQKVRNHRLVWWLVFATVGPKQRNLLKTILTQDDLQMKSYIKLSLTAAVSLLALISAAHASPATATTDVNVRSGPGSSFAILDQLYRGENVDVVECVQSGWCRVTQDGPSGWVYSRYLGQGNQGGNQGGGQGGNPANPQPQNQGNTNACFYTQPGHRGQSFCIGNGTVNQLPAPFNNSLSSYEVFGGAHVNFCTGSNMTGACYEGSRSTPTLGAALDNQASSLEVFGGSGGGNQANGGFNNNQGNQGGQQPNQGNQGNQGNQNNASDPNCSFGLVIDQNGQSSFALTCGDNPVLPPAGNGGNGNQGGNAGNGNGANAGNNNAGNNNAGGNQANNPPPLPPVAFADNEPGVCFFSKPNGGGRKFCSGIDRLGILNQSMFETVSSIKIYHRAKVTLCTEVDFRGRCDTFSRARANLPFGIDNKAQSAVIFVGNDDGIPLRRDPAPQAGGNNNGAGNPPPLPPAAQNDGNGQGNNGGAAPMPLPPVINAGVCFYNGENWRGYKRCYGANKEGQLVNLPRGTYPKSIALARGVQIKICSQEQLNGNCEIIKTTKEKLPSRLIRHGVGSVKFYTANRTPVVQTAGRMSLAGGESLDMDRHRRYAPNQGGTGAEFEIGAIPGGTFTLTFNSRVATAKYGTQKPGYIGCSLWELSTRNPRKYLLSSVRVNTYFCLRTTDGRTAALQYKGMANGKARFTSEVWRIR